MDFNTIKVKIEDQVRAALGSFDRTLRSHLQTKGFVFSSWLSVQDVQTSGTSTSITLLLRGTIEKVISGQPAFIRCSAECSFLSADLANFDKVPIPSTVTIRALMLEASVNTQGFDVKIGGGYDETTTPPYEVARVVLRMKGLGITFDAFIGGMSKDGFELTLGELPVCIPLGSTGLAISGITGTYANNFFPRLGTPPPKNPSAKNFLEWSRNQSNQLDAWVPTLGAEGIGLACTLITLADQGKLLRFKKAGFLLVSPPLVVMVGGMGVLLDADAAKLDMTGVIDFGDHTFYSDMSATVRLPPEDSKGFYILAAQGSMETFLSFSDPWASYFNLGTDSRPISGSFFNNALSCSVYLMINALRIQAGARLGIQFQLNLGPIGCGCSISIEGKGLIGRNPLQIFASLAVMLSFSIHLWKFHFGFGLKVLASVSVPNPVALELYVELTLGLPWPLSDVTFGVKLLNFTANSPAPNIGSPLRLANALPVAGMKPGAMHPLSGHQWLLDSEKIWPDAELVIPFSLRPIDRTGVIQPYTIAPLYEQGWDVSHSITTLVINRVHEDGTLTPVPHVRGVWTAGTDARGTAMLNLPGDDPFAWWRPYDPAGNIARQDASYYVDQYFGSGMDVANVPDGQRFGDVVCHPTQTNVVSLRNFRGFGDGRRTFQGSNFTFAFVDAAGTGIPVDEVSFILAGRDVGVAIPMGWKFVGAVRLSAIPDNPIELTLYTLRPEPLVPMGQITIAQGDAAALNILGVRYHVVLQKLQTWTPKPIMEPGKYRLSLYGESLARHAGQADVHSVWPKTDQDFTVTYPDLLRPYIRYSTLGDSRIFSGLVERWNPTPHGVGFPLYSSYQGVIRFFVPYMDQIFPSLKVALDDMPPQNFNPQKNMLDEVVIPPVSKSWASRNGAAIKPEQELQLPSPWQPGHHTLTINFVPPLGSSQRLDRWDYQISQFKDFVTHIGDASSTFITLAHSAEGTRNSAPTPAGVWPAATASAVPLLSKDWLVPDGLASLVQTLDEQSSLRFLQFARRTRCTFGNRFDPLARLVLNPTLTSLEVLLDESERPYCLWLRTPEPIDWRRVTGQLEVLGHSLGQTVVTALSLTVLPSPDAASAFLICNLAGSAVRLPKADMKLTLNFFERIAGQSAGADPLPTLQRDASKHALSSETWSCVLNQPFGVPWPTPYSA
jgi:hypothetical protein